MGPIIIFDKSAFQAFSLDEMFYLEGRFYENLTPILGIEIVADLAKQSKKQKGTPQEQVCHLARKFGGSGPPVNMHYRSACIANLLGAKLAMTGQILIDYADIVNKPEGGRAMLIDLHPLSEAITRWSRGEFKQAEELTARSWRRITRNLSYSAFRRQLENRHLIE